MRLLDVLENYRPAREGAAPGDWFDGDSPEPWKARKCSHSVTKAVIGGDGQPKKDRSGKVITRTTACRHDAVPGYEICRQHGAPKQLAPARGGTFSSDGAYRLQQILADVDRQIDALPKIFRAMFHHLYRAPLPLGPKEIPADWTPDREAERRQQIMHQLGYRQPRDFNKKHDELVLEMEGRLIDWFNDVRHQAPPVDELLEEGLAEMEAELAAAA